MTYYLFCDKCQNTIYQVDEVLTGEVWDNHPTIIKNATRCETTHRGCVKNAVGFVRVNTLKQADDRKKLKVDPAGISRTFKTELENKSG